MSLTVYTLIPKIEKETLKTLKNVYVWTEMFSRTFKSFGELLGFLDDSEGLTHLAVKIVESEFDKPYYLFYNNSSSFRVVLYALAREFHFYSAKNSRTDTWIDIPFVTIEEALGKYKYLNTHSVNFVQKIEEKLNDEERNRVDSEYVEEARSPSD